MISYKKLVSVLIITLSSTLVLKAQQEETGSWTILNLKSVLKNKLSLQGELQLRSLSFYDRFYYYEAKSALTYAISTKYAATIGTGFYNTFNEGIHFDDYDRQIEIRLWEQFTMEQKISILKIEQRIRIEQRFKENYDNRFRYRLNIIIPLLNNKKDEKILYAVAYDEVFFKDKAPNFSRNRFHAGLGYLLNKSISLQAGWLKQEDFNDKYNRKKSYALLSLGFKI